MKPLTTNHHYFYQGDQPFFWLADTAWLLFANTSEEEAGIYLRNRAEKGFNVIQAVLVYAADGMSDLNKMPVKRTDINTEAYWSYCDRIIQMAKEYGLYMALLPCWGWIVKRGILNKDNVVRYGTYLTKRYQNYDNIIWLLGGDVRAKGYEEIYRTLGRTLKQGMPEALIGFHPFGRCTSTLWFANEDWLDFNMFQSGHRRYDQCTMNAWDDTDDPTSLYGEDNWKFVMHDHALADKPTLDGEPSYEQIPQGLHDPSQPYWQACDVRRYAWWSVLAGAAGHTYGDNSVIDFYDGTASGVTYGAIDHWKDAIHHEASGQMKYMKQVMESFDYTKGTMRDDLLISSQKEHYERIAVFASEESLLAYSYSGHSFTLNTSDYINASVYFMNPKTGDQSYSSKVTGPLYHYQQRNVYGSDSDVLLMIRK